MPASAVAQWQHQPFVPAPAKVDRESVRPGRVSATILMLRFGFNVNIYVRYTLISIIFPQTKIRVIFWLLQGIRESVRALSGQTKGWHHQCGGDFSGGKSSLPALNTRSSATA